MKTETHNAYFRWFLAAVFLVSISFVGCSHDTVDQTNANGFVCQKCGFKFYTDRKVFAEFCPSCKDAYIRPVVAYLCDKDQQLTLTVSAHGSGICSKCQSPVSASMLPQEKDLVAWGAVKKTRAEVCRK